MLWEIPEDYPSLSDHELILLRWEDLNHDLPNKDPATPAGSDIQGLTKPSEDLELASADWKSQSKSRKLLDQTSNQKHLNEEVD